MSPDKPVVSKRTSALRLLRLARSEDLHAEATLPPAAAAPAPVVEEPPVVEQPRPVEAPRIDPKEVLEESGLVMIETDRSKAPAAPVAEEPQHLGRPRRERPRPATPQDEELVQVETSRK